MKIIIQYYERKNSMIGKYELSQGALEARRAYYRSRKTSHPESKELHRKYSLHVWENKAKALHGKNYVPALPGEEISRQAAQIRRDYQRDYRKKNAESVRRYQRDYRKKHPEKMKQYVRDYWERKAAT